MGLDRLSPNCCDFDRCSVTLIEDHITEGWKKLEVLTDAYFPNWKLAADWVGDFWGVTCKLFRSVTPGSVVLTSSMQKFNQSHTLLILPEPQSVFRIYARWKDEDNHTYLQITFSTTTTFELYRVFGGITNQIGDTDICEQDFTDTPIKIRFCVVTDPPKDDILTTKDLIVGDQDQPPYPEESHFGKIWPGTADLDISGNDNPTTSNLNLDELVAEGTYFKWFVYTINPDDQLNGKNYERRNHYQYVKTDDYVPQGVKAGIGCESENEIKVLLNTRALNDESTDIVSHPVVDAYETFIIGVQDYYDINGFYPTGNTPEEQALILRVREEYNPPEYQTNFVAKPFLLKRGCISCSRCRKHGDYEENAKTGIWEDAVLDHHKYYTLQENGSWQITLTPHQTATAKARLKFAMYGPLRALYPIFGSQYDYIFTRVITWDGYEVYRMEVDHTVAGATPPTPGFPNGQSLYNLTITLDGVTAYSSLRAGRGNNVTDFSYCGDGKYVINDFTQVGTWYVRTGGTVLSDDAEWVITDTVSGMGSTGSQSYELSQFEFHDWCFITDTSGRCCECPE